MIAIIGITGTIGAGKGTIVEYLVNEKGFVHLSVRDFLIQQIKERKLPINRDSMVVVANELRRIHSPSYIIECLVDTAKKINKNAVIESIRTPGEIAFLRRQNNFFLLAVDANPEIRFQRIVKRNSETDQVTFEEFLSNEEREMTATDENKQNLSQCIRLSDSVLYNDNSIEDLYLRLEVALEKFK